MSLDTKSIDKEVARLGVVALMFWELPKVENALKELCHSWFRTDYREIREIFDVTGTQESLMSMVLKKEKEHCIELGFVDKTIELQRLRKKVFEAKAEISASGVLGKYTYKAGEAIMSKTLTYKSSYMTQLPLKRKKQSCYDGREKIGFTDNV